MPATLLHFASNYQRMRSVLGRLSAAPPALLQQLIDPATLSQLLHDSQTIGIGTPATADELPQCALLWNSASDTPFASGILVGPNTVLTAGHVQDDVGPNFVALDISDGSQRQTTEVRVTACLRTAGTWSIAVYRLASQSTLTPVPVATTAEFEAFRASGQTVTIYGFGSGVTTAGAILPGGIKRYLDGVPILPDSSALARAIQGYDPNAMFAIGALGDAAPFGIACSGDSGGPVFAEIGGEQKLIGVFQQVFGGAGGKGAAPRECGLATMAAVSRADQSLSCAG